MKTIVLTEKEFKLLQKTMDLHLSIGKEGERAEELRVKLRKQGREQRGNK